MSEQLSQQPSGTDEKREQPKLTIWVIDDDPDNIIHYTARRVIGSIPNVTVWTFKTAKEALDTLRELGDSDVIMPSIILVDGNLDKDDGELRQGETVVKRIKDVHPGIFVVAHSAKESANDAMQKVGADAVIQKPAKNLRVDVMAVVDKVRKSKKNNDV